MATNVFLAANATFTAADNGLKIVGKNAGNEVLRIANGVTGVETDANIERVELAGAIADYKFAILADKGLVITNAAGGVIATIPSLNQNATVAFSDGSAALVQTGKTTATLGTVALTATAATVSTTLNTADKSTVTGSTGGGTPTTGQAFTLTNNPTADALILTTGNDTVTGAAGTMVTADMIIDATTTDADKADLTVNSYTQDAVQPTISNVETLNIIGAFTAAGIDMTNVSGAKTINLSVGIAGGTATVDDVNATKVATAIVAGTNVNTLNVNTGAAAAFTNGTAGNVNIDRGAATTVSIGNVGNTGADTYTVSSIANGTTVLRGGSAGTDTFTVNLVGGASNLTITNSAAATADINVLNLNSNTSANTVTLTSATDEVVENTATDKIVVGGTQALTIVGDGDVIAGTSARTAATQGGIVTKAAGAGTLTLNSNGALGAASFFNNAAFDVIANTAAFGANVTLNEVTTVKLVTAEAAARTFDVDTVSSATAMVAGAGTLKVDLAGTTVDNATQVGITTGVGVGTLVITNSTIDSTITTLNTVSATVDTVVLNGTKALTIGTWTATANEVMTAGNLTGNLVATIGATGATVIGGEGNDTITGGAGSDSISGGKGNDVLTGAVQGTVDGVTDTLTGGLGNDTFIHGDAAAITTVTDFSISGTNGIDNIALSVGDLGLTLKDGNAVAVIAGATAKVATVSANKTLAAGDNVVVLTGTFASAAAMELAIETGGARQLTFASALTANDDVVVVWSDGVNSHVGFYNDAVGATTLGATGTYTELVTLTGVASVDAAVSGNFQFLV